MCYGAWGGALFITFSVFVTTTIIVLTVKKFGRKYLYNFFSKEKIQKIEKNKLLKGKKTVEITLFLLFLIPGTPKDLLVYMRRTASNKTNKIYININICKASFGYNIHICWSKNFKSGI